MPLALDLYAGTGGATAAFRERGWTVVGVELDARHAPDVVADVTRWTWAGARPDLVWASPPCTEFTRRALPWLRAQYPAPPSLELVDAARRIIAATRPRYWVIENVRGAVRWLRPLLGEFRAHVGPFFLWGEFPAFPAPPLRANYKQGQSSRNRVERGHVPLDLSRALADAIDRELRLLAPTTRELRP